MPHVTALILKTYAEHFLSTTTALALNPHHYPHEPMIMSTVTYIIAESLSDAPQFSLVRRRLPKRLIAGHDAPRVHLPIAQCAPPLKFRRILLIDICLVLAPVTL